MVRKAETVKGYFWLRAAEDGGGVTGEDYVVWAQDALECGLDSPSLLRLAIEEPPHYTPKLQRLFDRALDELEIERITGEQAAIAHAQAIAADILSGRISPASGARRIYSALPREVLWRGFGVWAEIDDALLDASYRTYFEAGYGSVEDAIRAEAQRLVDCDWRSF